MERQAAESRAGWSVRELSDALDVASESLYYHVHALVKAGLLQRLGERPAGRRREQLYRLIAPEIVIDPDQRSRAFVAALGDVGATALRAAERGYRAALPRARSDPASGGVAQVRRWVVRLEPRSAAQLQDKLRELERFMQEHDVPGGQRYELTAVLTSLGSAPGATAVMDE
jgi:hypothetical protein